MMTFGGGWFGWLGPLTMLGLLVGVVLVVTWAVQAGGRQDDALAALRARFAGGDIDAEQFEAMRRTLGADDGRRPATSLGIIGLVLIVAAVVLGMLMAWSSPGWDWMGSGGMMGPGGMMGVGAGPTAPAGTSATQEAAGGTTKPNGACHA